MLTPQGLLEAADSELSEWEEEVLTHNPNENLTWQQFRKALLEGHLQAPLRNSAILPFVSYKQSQTELNSVIRKAINKRKLFPTDEAAKKVVYLAITDASKKWTMPIRNWKTAMNHFMIQFEERLQDYV